MIMKEIHEKLIKNRSVKAKFNKTERQTKGK
jgi:hypothetical protein